MSFKQKVAAFFYGRYGVDQLYKFLMVVWIAILVANLIVSNIMGAGLIAIILSFVGIAIVVFMTFRVFSKNIVARRIENERYLKVRNKIVGWFKLNNRKFKERKTHSYQKCPNCKKTIRLKKQPGEHTARCPLCGGTFKVTFK